MFRFFNIMYPWEKTILIILKTPCRSPQLLNQILSKHTYSDKPSGARKRRKAKQVSQLNFFPKETPTRTLVELSNSWTWHAPNNKHTLLSNYPRYNSIEPTCKLKYRELWSSSTFLSPSVSLSSPYAQNKLHAKSHNIYADASKTCDFRKHVSLALC